MLTGNRGSHFILAAAVGGLILSAWLTYLHIRLHTDVGYMSFCALNEGLNCETVAASVFSVFLGLPVSVWGILAYAAIILTAFLDIRARNKGSLIALMTVLCFFAGIGSLVLALISAMLIGSTCLFCSLSHVLSLLMVVAAIRELKKRGGLKINFSLEFAALKRSPIPLYYLAAILVIGIVAGPLGAMPKYWTYAYWRTHSGIPSGYDDEGRAWIGARNPELIVHEYFDYECPGCQISHRKVRRILGQHASVLRLVRHNYARMRCIPNDNVVRSTKCSMARGAYCAGKQGSHWEWNDAALAEPKPLIGQSRKDYETKLAKKLKLNMTEFEECLFAKETIDNVQNQYLEAKKVGINETPAYMVDGQKINLDELSKRIR